MPSNLSDLINVHIDQMFDASDRPEVRKLLFQICETGGGGQASNRCEIAALKISHGSLEGLRRAVNLYHTDFRDLLMSAGFGFDAGAHERWKPDRI